MHAAPLHTPVLSATRKDVAMDRAEPRQRPARGSRQGPRRLAITLAIARALEGGPTSAIRPIRGFPMLRSARSLRSDPGQSDRIDNQTPASRALTVRRAR